MNPIPLGILSSQEAAIPEVDYYLSRLRTTANRIYGFGVAVADDYSFYVVGEDRAYNATDAYILQYDPTGSIQWKKFLGGSGIDGYQAVTSVTDNEIVAVGGTASQGSGSYDQLIAKYDSSGSVTWQVILGGTNIDRLYGVAADSAGNIYGVGHHRPAADYLANIWKVDSSGSIQWQRKLAPPTNDEAEFLGVAVDSSDNIYAVGQIRPAFGSDVALIAKYDTSGNLIWQKRLNPTTNNESIFEAVAVDASGNIYAAGYNERATGIDEALVVKYDSSGSLLWQRVLGNTSNSRADSISVDSNNDVIIVGYNDDPTTSNDWLIAKYDSSGVIQWQRELGASLFEQAYGVATDGAGNIYVAGQTTSTTAGVNNDTLISVLPGDGSLTGTYLLDGVNFTYAAGSFTDSAGSLTDATSTLTSSATSMVFQTSTLTEATATFTEDITYL